MNHEEFDGGGGGITIEIKTMFLNTHATAAKYQRGLAETLLIKTLVVAIFSDVTIPCLFLLLWQTIVFIVKNY